MANLFRVSGILAREGQSGSLPPGRVRTRGEVPVLCRVVENVFGLAGDGGFLLDPY